MPQREPKALLSPRRLAALCAPALLAFQLKVLFAPPLRQVGYLPDDAYYYLALARNYIRYGYWTFDNGRTVTSGFQPLWAWILSSLYAWFRPGPEAFVRLAVLCGMLLYWAAAALLFASLPAGRKGWACAAAGLLALFSPNAALQSVSAMEWPVVVLAAVLYWRLAARGASGAGAAAALFWAGLAGSLARVDFGLLPACWLLAALAARALGRRVQPLGPLAAGLLGAAAGAALVLAYDRAYTGTFVQGSAALKLAWAARGGRAPGRPFGVLLSLFPGGFGRPAKAAGLLLLAAALAALWRRRRGTLRRLLRRGAWSPGVTAQAACLAALAGYLGLYALSSEVQPWYSANLFVPVLVPGLLLFRLLGPWRRAALAALLAWLLLDAAFLASPLSAAYDGQRSGYLTAQVLRPLPGERWAAWDCGVLGYYCDCGLINLDGLVNNEVPPLVAEGNFAAYFRQRPINRILGTDPGDADRAAWFYKRGMPRARWRGELKGRLGPGAPAIVRVWRTVY